MDTLTSTEDNNGELVLKELYILDIMPCYCEEAFHVADEVLDTKIKAARTVYLEPLEAL